MIDIVKFLYTYDNDDYGVCVVDVVDGTGSYYRDASFSIQKEADSGRFNLSMDFYSPFKEGTYIKQKKIYEPLHNYEFIVKNIHVRLFHCNHSNMDVKIYFDNCIISKTMYNNYKNTNCIISEQND